MNDEFVKEIIAGKAYMSMQNLADKYGISKKNGQGSRQRDRSRIRQRKAI